MKNLIGEVIGAVIVAFVALLFGGMFLRVPNTAYIWVGGSLMFIAVVAMLHGARAVWQMLRIGRGESFEISSL